jgi:hypothetical protein
LAIIILNQQSSIKHRWNVTKVDLVLVNIGRILVLIPLEMHRIVVISDVSTQNAAEVVESEPLFTVPLCEHTTEWRDCQSKETPRACELGVHFLEHRATERH